MSSSKAAGVAERGAAQPVGEDPIPIDRTLANRCSYCRTTFCKGLLAPGTAIEIVCRRCGGRFQIIVAGL